jgi:hypothetical protein
MKILNAEVLERANNAIAIKFYCVNTPDDIETNQILEYIKSFEPIDKLHIEPIPVCLYMENNGHNIKLIILNPDGTLEISDELAEAISKKQNNNGLRIESSMQTFPNRLR